MSRGNVFKLSGNMALNTATGTAPNYQNQISNAMNSHHNQYNETSEIKSSLKQLKSKQNQRKTSEDVFDGNLNYGNYGNGGSNYGTGNQNPQSEQLNRNSKNYGNYGNGNLNTQSKDVYDIRGQQNYNRAGKPPIMSKKAKNNYDYQGNDIMSQYQNQNKVSSAKKQTEFDYGSTADRSRGNNRNRNSNLKNVDSSEDQGYGNQKPSQGYGSKSSQRVENKPAFDNQYQPKPKYNGGSQSKIGRSSQSIGNRRGRPQPIEPQKLTYNSPNQERAIRQVNKESQMDIVEYDPSEFVECRQGCGRKFNPGSVGKHQLICKKVFQKKRKEFNAQAHRQIQGQQPKMMKRGMAAEKKVEAKKPVQKMAKWKQESLAFRAVLKQNQKGGLTDAEKKMIQKAKDAEEDSMVKCPHCGRTFNHTAGPRHVKFCGDQQKKLGNRKKK